MKTVKLTNGQQMVVDLVSQDDDWRLLGRDYVSPSDLALARDETWREGVRSGALGLSDPAAYSMQVIAGKREKGFLSGFRLQLGNNGQDFEREFPIHCLAPVARRRAAELLQQKAIEGPNQFHFCLNSVPSGNGEDQESADRERQILRVVKSVEAVEFEEASLQDYLDRSEVMPRATAALEEESESPMPVFLTGDLWEQGLKMARRGGQQESAAVWTGRLMRDTDSPEIFVVIDACIEAEHAEESEVSVTFSGETWSRVREVLRQRRKRLKRPHERIVGAVHGHNFLPEANEAGQRMCEACAAAKYCGRTTAAASVADFEWFAAVFARQPWAVSLIHGYNARGEDDWRLYHLSAGTLVPRTLRRLLS